MITDALIDFFGGFMGWVVSLIFSNLSAPPGWVTSALSGAGTAWTAVQSASTWVPVDTALTVAAAILATWFICGVITLVRMIISYFTLGGGVT